MYRANRRGARQIRHSDANLCFTDNNLKNVYLSYFQLDIAQTCINLFLSFSALNQNQDIVMVDFNFKT